MHWGSATSGLTALVLLLVSDDQTRQCEWEPSTPTKRVQVCHCYEIAHGTFGNVRVEVSCWQESQLANPN